MESFVLFSPRRDAGIQTLEKPCVWNLWKHVKCSPLCLLPLYQPRDPHASDLWQLLDQHFDTFRQVYDERYQAKYGFWRSIVQQSVAAFLKCGDLQEGFARVRCVRL